MMRSFPRARWAALASILVLTFLSGGWLLRPRPSAEGGVYEQARLFEGVVGAINRHYIDSLGEGDLYQRAADALVGSLHDPYAELLIKDSYREYQRQMAGTEIDLELGRRNRVGKGARAETSSPRAMRSSASTAKAPRGGRPSGWRRRSGRSWVRPSRSSCVRGARIGPGGPAFHPHRGTHLGRVSWGACSTARWAMSCSVG